MPEQFSPSAENNSGGENVVQEELAIVADNTSCHEDFNNPDGGNGINETEIGRNTDSGRTGSSSEGIIMFHSSVLELMVFNLMNNGNLNEITALPPQRGGRRKATRGVLLDKMTNVMG